MSEKEGIPGTWPPMPPEIADMTAIMSSMMSKTTQDTTAAFEAVNMKRDRMSFAAAFLRDAIDLGTLAAGQFSDEAEARVWSEVKRVARAALRLADILIEEASKS